MGTLVSEGKKDPIAARRLDTDILRKWSSPDVILVVSDHLDEESLQFHAIQQARQSGAKVLVVEVDEGSVVARTHHLRGVVPTGSFRNPRETAARMASHIRHSGIACEPVIVRGLRADEIPAIARSCRADRVLVSAPTDSPDDQDRPGIAEKIIDRLDIPVCVVGRNPLEIFRYQRPSRRITLVLSLRARNDIPIVFSSHLAQQTHSQLTIMHVFPKGTRNGGGTGEVQASFVSHLPPAILKEAGLLCPLEISVKVGDPSTEIVNHESRLNQDFLILAPPRDAGPIGFGMSVVRTMIRAARCPVIVLMERPENHSVESPSTTESCDADRSWS